MRIGKSIRYVHMDSIRTVDSHYDYYDAAEREFYVMVQVEVEYNHYLITCYARRSDLAKYIFAEWLSSSE